MSVGGRSHVLYDLVEGMINQFYLEFSLQLLRYMEGRCEVGGREDAASSFRSRVWPRLARCGFCRRYQSVNCGEMHAKKLTTTHPTAAISRPWHRFPFISIKIYLTDNILSAIGNGLYAADTWYGVCKLF